MTKDGETVVKLESPHTLLQPGVFFDINPRGLKQVHRSPCIANVRFSYGPKMVNLERGIEAIGEMIKEWKGKLQARISEAKRAPEGLQQVPDFKRSGNKTSTTFAPK